MLVLTFAPYTLTVAPCACSGCHWQRFMVVALLPQPLAQTPLGPAVVSPIAACTLVFFLPPTGADTRHTLGQLALCGGGNIYIYISCTVYIQCKLQYTPLI